KIYLRMLQSHTDDIAGQSVEVVEEEEVKAFTYSRIYALCVGFYAYRYFIVCAIKELRLKYQFFEYYIFARDAIRAESERFATIDWPEIPFLLLHIRFKLP
ncbi:6743_t:CDS:1, partial [Paraglomus occultum]